MPCPPPEQGDGSAAAILGLWWGAAACVPPGLQRGYGTFSLNPK